MDTLTKTSTYRVLDLLDVYSNCEDGRGRKERRNQDSPRPGGGYDMIEDQE